MTNWWEGDLSMNSTMEHNKCSPDLCQHLQQLMNDRGVPGLQIAVVRDGRIEVLDEMGLANIEHQVAVTDTSVFSINSMSKAFTGVAVMQLVEAGKIELAAPISRYLDDLPEVWKAITVQQLAKLVSGVPEMMRYTADFNVTLVGDGTDESAWAEAYSAPMEYPTGKGYRYTQTNYALLGKIIEGVSGQHFTSFIADHQFGPAGMTNTLHGTDQDIIPNRANSYMNINSDGEPVGKIFNSTLNWPRVLQTAAGMHSTAKDLASWAIALEQGVLLKDPASIRMMRTTEPMHDSKPGIWGIGWLVGRSKVGRVPAPGGGAKAQLVFYPNGLTIVLLTNLLGAFPEHLAPVTADEIDLTFTDEIAGYFGL